MRRFSLRASVDGERFTRRVVRSAFARISHLLTRLEIFRCGIGDARARARNLQMSKNARLRVTDAMHGQLKGFLDEREALAAVARREGVEDVVEVVQGEVRKDG